MQTECQVAANPQTKQTDLAYESASRLPPSTSTKVRTDSSTKCESNRILTDRIWIESMAGSNLILIVQNRTALDHVVDFNESVNAFTTGRATKMARSAQSSETSMCTISAELHLILCTTTTHRDSNFRHDHRTTGHALWLCVISGGNGRCCMGGRTILWPPTKRQPLSGYIFWRSIKCHCWYQITGSPKQRWPILLDQSDLISAGLFDL